MPNILKVRFKCWPFKNQSFFLLISNGTISLDCFIYFFFMKQSRLVPFENWTIPWPNTFRPFKYRTCPVFGSPLYFYFKIYIFGRENDNLYSAKLQRTLKLVKTTYFFTPKKMLPFFFALLCATTGVILLTTIHKIFT